MSAIEELKEALAASKKEWNLPGHRSGFPTVKITEVAAEDILTGLDTLRAILTKLELKPDYEKLKAISSSIDAAMFAGTLGMGGDIPLREGIRQLREFCKELPLAAKPYKISHEEILPLDNDWAKPKCEMCDGSGKVFDGTEDIPIYLPCPDCGGSGKENKDV